MRYSKENVVEDSDITISNITSPVGLLEYVTDHRTTRSYAATHDGQDDIVVDVEFKADGLSARQTIDLVTLVGFTGETGGPVAHYSFDDGTARDVSGNGNDGTLSGFDGPVARYAFDGDATDSSGNGNDGTASGVTYTTGKAGQAASFAESGDWVDIPSQSFADQEPHSFSVWCKWDPDDVTTWVVPLGDRSTITTDSIYFCQGIDAKNKPGIRWRDGGGGQTHLTPSDNWFDNEWHHIVCTVDSDRLLKLYVDGEYEDGATLPESGMKYASIGQGYDGNRFGNQGLMDEVRIYSRALSASEVSALYSRPTGSEYIVDGKSRKALSTFSSYNDHVLVSSLPKPSGAFTISGWYKGTYDKDDAGRALAGAQSDGDYVWIMGYRPAGSNFQNYVRDASGTAIFETSSFNITDGEWHHIAFVVDPGNLTAYTYTDGSLNESFTIGSGLWGSDWDLYIGKWRTGAFGVPGDYDEFRIYDRALSAAEVASLYSDPATEPTDGRIEIDLIDGQDVVDTAVMDLAQPVEQTYYSARFTSVEATAMQLRFYIPAGAQFAIGYLYAGELSSELTIATEALSYSVESTDPRNITRAGTVLRSDGYRFATLDVTLVEETFSALRTRITEFATGGFATPRLWYFDEDCILTGEAIYGILDSDSLQLDPRFYRKGSEARAVTTMGIQEVF